jgi:hypothetical protein
VQSWNLHSSNDMEESFKQKSVIPCILDSRSECIRLKRNAYIWILSSYMIYVCVPECKKTVNWVNPNLDFNFIWAVLFVLGNVDYTHSASSKSARCDVDPVQGLPNKVRPRTVLALQKSGCPRVFSCKVGRPSCSDR